MLYKEGSQFGMYVVSLDIQRGRDHGLPGYNQFRKFCGRKVAKSFNDFLDVMPKSVGIIITSKYRNLKHLNSGR